MDDVLDEVALTSKARSLRLVGPLVLESLSVFFSDASFSIFVN